MDVNLNVKPTFARVIKSGEITAEGYADLNELPPELLQTFDLRPLGQTIAKQLGLSEDYVLTHYLLYRAKEATIEFSNGTDYVNYLIHF